MARRHHGLRVRQQNEKCLTVLEFYSQVLRRLAQGLTCSYSAGLQGVVFRLVLRRVLDFVSDRIEYGARLEGIDRIKLLVEGEDTHTR